LRNYLDSGAEERLLFAEIHQEDACYRTMDCSQG
jgi:hypothetical protein